MSHEINFMPKGFYQNDNQEVLIIRVDEPTMLRTLAFFEELGLKFVQEQHGGGPLHWACMSETGIAVLEIYPERKKSKG